MAYTGEDETGIFKLKSALKNESFNGFCVP